MHRARLLASLVAVATVTTAAFPQRLEAQRATKGDRERAAKARDAFDDGKKAYNLGDFDKAIDLWKQGYELKDDPIFLFNIAQAYRQRGDYQKALFFYKAYLREDPRARNRDDVDARIVELQKLLEAQQNAIEPTPREPITDPVPTRPDPPVKPPTPVKPVPAPTAATDPPVVRDEGTTSGHPGRGLKIGGLVAGGVGLGATAAGVLFLLKSASLEGEVEDAAASGNPWTKDLMDKESQGKSNQTLGLLSVGVGIACLATGATLFFMGIRKDAAANREYQARWQLTPVVAPGLTAAAVTLSF